MLAGVMEIAREIAANAPLAVYGCKKAITYARDHSTADGLDWIGMWNASMLQSDEIQKPLPRGPNSARLILLICPAWRASSAKLFIKR